MQLPVQISIDFLLIARCFTALLWGILFALFLQHNRHGQFWAARRTWLAVVIGVGVDLLIAYGGDWLTVVAVITFSSVGIIGRSLVNEREEDLNPRSYKIKWGLEDGIALSNWLISELNDLLKNGQLGQEENRSVSRALGLAHQLSEKIKAARRGEYEKGVTRPQ